MIPNPYARELLAALRAALGDVEGIRMSNANDPELVRLKKGLREKIAEFEAEELADS
jgi:hypothetical protein